MNNHFIHIFRVTKIATWMIKAGWDGKSEFEDIDALVARAKTEFNLPSKSRALCVNPPNEDIP